MAVAAARLRDIHLVTSFGLSVSLSLSLCFSLSLSLPLSLSLCLVVSLFVSLFLALYFSPSLSRLPLSLHSVFITELKARGGAEVK